jgi:hypothetical protein
LPPSIPKLIKQLTALLQAEVQSTTVQPPQQPQQHIANVMPSRGGQLLMPPLSSAPRPPQSIPVHPSMPMVQVGPPPPGLPPGQFPMLTMPPSSGPLLPNPGQFPGLMGQNWNPGMMLPPGRPPFPPSMGPPPQFLAPTDPRLSIQQPIPQHLAFQQNAFPPLPMAKRAPPNFAAGRVMKRVKQDNGPVDPRRRGSEVMYDDLEGVASGGDAYELSSGTEEEKEDS